MMSLGSPAWSTVWMLKICGLVFIALTVLFLPFPQIDLWVSKQVYLGENESLGHTVPSPDKTSRRVNSPRTRQDSRGSNS